MVLSSRSLTRRRALALSLSGIGLASGLLPACQVSSGAPDMVPGRALYAWTPDRVLLSEVTGSYDGRFTLDRPFRIASISKMMVADLVRRLERAGRLDRSMSITRIMPDLHHPEFPDVVITLDHLIRHRSGVIDPPAYWMAAPGDIRDLLGDQIFEPGAKPGASFRYSNLNYGLAATLIEIATGQRFDQLFTDFVARPMGLDIGFNWSGVSPAKRALGVPLFRGAPGDWTVQADGPATLASDQPAVLHAKGWMPDQYEPGRNGTLFSPQGGLRASVRDMAAMVDRVLREQPALWTPSWQWDGVTRPHGPSEDGHFIAFGDGLYIYPKDRSPLPGVRLVGHHGEAYGFYGGAWLAPDLGVGFVHADLGSPADGSPMRGGMPNNTAAATRAFAALASVL